MAAFVQAFVFKDGYFNINNYKWPCIISKNEDAFFHGKQMKYNLNKHIS